jgi:hypothetical protein
MPPGGRVGTVVKRDVPGDNASVFPQEPRLWRWRRKDTGRLAGWHGS